MDKRRISGYLPSALKKRIDLSLFSLGWSESDFVEHAITYYLPTFFELSEKMETHKVAAP